MENKAIYNTKNRVPGMDEVKLIQAIYCSKKRVGLGADLSPMTICVEIFDIDGTLLAQNNPLLKYTDRDLFDFFNFLGEMQDNFKDYSKSFAEFLKLWEKRKNEPSFKFER